MKKAGLVFSILFISIASTSYAQQEDDYEYVLPESSIEEDKSRSNLSLPIKGKSDDQNYYVPSYYEKNGQDLEAIDENELEEDESLTKDENRTSVHLEVGTSFSSDFNGNSAVTAYVAPHIRHRLSKDIAISGGLIMSQTYLNGWTNYSIDGNPMPSSINRTTMYASLEYQVSDRMLLYGTIYQHINTMPSSFGHGGGQQVDGLGYSVGMDYKISDRSFLQIQIHRNSGYNPFSPYGNSFGFGGRPVNYFP